MTTKNISLIFLAAIVVGGAFFVNEYRNKNSQKQLYLASGGDIIATTSKIAAESNLTDNLDTDHDGLKDWEEILWKTDPKNPDSDGDATPDGTEVQAGRNPLVKKTKTVNDSFAALAKKAAVTASSSESMTLTDSFGRDVFSQYMQLRQMGLSGDKDSQQELIDQLLSGKTFDATAKVYTDKDLKTRENSEKASIKQYGNDIGAIFKNNSISSRSEGVIVKDSLDKEDPTILKELDPIIASYKNIINALLKATAPKLMLTQHKNLVNSMSDVLFVVESLRKTDADPATGLLGVAKYTEASKNFFDAMQAVKNYIGLAGVTYAATEPGSLFNPPTQ